MLTAATVSEQHITEEKSRISVKVSLKGEYSPVPGLYLSKLISSNSKKFNIEKAMKATNVPMTPNKVM